MPVDKSEPAGCSGPPVGRTPGRPDWEGAAPSAGHPFPLAQMLVPSPACWSRVWSSCWHSGTALYLQSQPGSLPPRAAMALYR